MLPAVTLSRPCVPWPSP